MKTGAFSISLSVKDLDVSKSFYEKLGFEVFAGDAKMNYLIMKNGDALIGLFQGMFEGNIITFNPGWDQSAQPVDPFDDVRDMQKSLIKNGITPVQTVEEGTTGPGRATLKDPDGNVILIDQHR